MTTITVCTTCRTADKRERVEDRSCGEALLADVVRAARGLAGLRVRGVACLMGCDHGCNVAISDAGKMAYVLGRFQPAGEDAAAIVAYALRHRESASGVVPYREWPQGVKGHFVARVPPVGHDTQD
jgi:predicted metal-binding protein